MQTVPSSPISFNKQSFFRRKWVKVTVWIVGIILFLLLSAALVGYWFVSKSHPNLEGVTQISQLEGEVTVHRDERGVAQIHATNLEDLFFIQGYVTAQDRLFQMDMTRRLAGGRLSEVVGGQALDNDRFFRTYGMHRETEALVEKFSPETSSMVDAYVAGVNAYMEEAFAEGEQPLEFRLMGYEPEPWTSEDTALVVKYMGYTLSGNFRSELDNYRIAKTLGEDAHHFFPEFHIDENFPTIYTYGEESPFSFDKLENLAAFAPNEFNGSNNWAISGEHTLSGYPLVADDPHLGHAIPSVWYQTHLNLEGDFHSMGVTVPGVPGVVLGHNGEMAWGVTAMSVDQEDLFLEQVHPENPQLYLYDGEWEQATVIEELIYMDGVEEPHVELVEITRNGPIINKIVGDAPYQAISLRWTGREAGEELNGVLRLNRATNVEEFMQGLDGFVTPALSWVFADRSGNIGYRGQALLPVRQNSNGLFPVPGWDPDYQWDGFIPNEELPQIINPESGYIMTANNKPVDDNYPYEIGRSFYPYRAERLDEIIQGQIDNEVPFTIDQMKEMQVDFLNTQARALAPILVEALERYSGEEDLSDLELRALAKVKEWDFVESPESGAALVWNQWYNQLGSGLFEDLLGFQYDHSLVIHRVLQEAHEHEQNVLFAYLDEDKQLNLDEVARQTFGDAVNAVEELQGDNPNRWNWGSWHAMTIEHPLSAVWPLNYLFDLGTWELGGSGATPGAAGYNRSTGQVTHGAGWRFAGDLESVDSFYDILMPGQSGQVFSPFYSDQVDTWAEGELLPMIYNKEEHSDVKTKVFQP
ncbi:MULTISPECIES: penicillin acylase family protein [Bacillaceae]|uniref:Penicillin acylase family protein n=1 Tax=Evansella alkalicola TaxID=745819 RepID=A0ABS6JN43_9BACI|nr:MULTISPECIES: penicillin acylase family protein [Bacillaceae]MBU9719983.1 penicillin acylase family protein [Bacillus alkalicola]